MIAQPPTTPTHTPYGTLGGPNLRVTRTAVSVIAKYKGFQLAGRGSVGGGPGGEEYEAALEGLHDECASLILRMCEQNGPGLPRRPRPSPLIITLVPPALAPCHVQWAAAATPSISPTYPNTLSPLSLPLFVGGLFIKMGQYCSSLRNSLPPQYCDRLQALEDSCPERPFSAIRKTLEEELGPLEGWCEWVEETPLGSARHPPLHSPHPHP